MPRELWLNINLPRGWLCRAKDDQFNSSGPGWNLIYHLVRGATEQGYSCHEATDFVAARVPLGVERFLISEQPSALRVAPELSAGCRSLLFSLESPLQAKKFYLSLGRLTRQFDVAWLYGFAGPSARCAVRQLFFPRADPLPISPPSTAAKRFMVLINSHKSASGFWRGGSSIDLLKTASRKALMRLLRRHPIFSGGDNYKKRRDFILDASSLLGAKNFDLYGRGWEIEAAANTRLGRAVAPCYRGSSVYSKKYSTLVGYKFCVCFENTNLKGYITEKIHDCLLTGAIPIYLGAPDISTYIAEESYVDCRKFDSNRDLIKYLLALSPQELRRFEAAGREFLSSPRAQAFDAKYLADGMLKSLFA